MFEGVRFDLVLEIGCLFTDTNAGLCFLGLFSAQLQVTLAFETATALCG